MGYIQVKQKSLFKLNKYRQIKDTYLTEIF